MMTTPSDFQETYRRARRLQDDVEAMVARLRTIEPYLIDLSLRENPVGARVGQTLADKLAIFPKLREFGFKNILLGTLDYAMQDEPEVDDDFMIHLRDHNVDRTGCFAFSQIGISSAPGQFVPDPSQVKLKTYGVPNTLHEIYLSKLGMQGQYDRETLKRSVVASIDWVVKNVPGDHGARPRILINIVDACDAFAEDPAWTCEVLALLAQQPIEGISMEDDRGTYLPCQVGAFVAMARLFMPAPLKIVVHMHSGGGFENASVLEALMNGADGAWGGLPKRAAIIGHASLGELIANLVRVGNPHMAETYQLEQLTSFATKLQVLDEEEPVPDDLPILGNNAYRLTLSFFKQLDGRYMDLPPEKIGGRYGFRVCPVVSDPPVLAGRLAEVTGRRAEDFPQDVLQQMVRLMRRDLRAGKRIVYDEPSNLLALYARAAPTTN
jgi:isopropylmalate/homocitrate/citramalate synthase